MATARLVACRECDLLHRQVILPPRGEARCTRCGSRISRWVAADTNDRSLAMALAACILFVVANAFPILGLEVQGLHSSTTLFQAVRSLWSDEAYSIAALVLATTILMPAAELLAITWVLLSLRRGVRGRGAVPMLHFIEKVKPWGMVEVFVLGILVSLVKLAHIATVEPGLALYSFGALMMLIAATAASFDADAAWAQLEQIR